MPLDPFRELLRSLPGDIELAREAGLPVILDVARPLPPHAQRLMDTLGVEVRIVTSQPFAANLIDFRHSVVQANKRADAGDDTLEICPHCMCEVDITPQPHRPGCSGIGGARATSSPVLPNVAPLARLTPTERPPVVPGSARNGLDALARMDAGLPQEPELDLDVDEPDGTVLEEREPQAHEAFEPPLTAVGADASRTAVGSGSRSPVAAEAASRSSSTRRGGWTRETMIAAIQSFVEANGHPPAHVHLTGNRQLPSAPAATRLFGSFGALVEAAGFDRPTRGTRYTKDSSSERAASQPVARGHARPAAGGGLDDEQPARGARTPAATADGSGEPVTGPSAPDPVAERTLAEPGAERLGPDSPGSAGARDAAVRGEEASDETLSAAITAEGASTASTSPNADELVLGLALEQLVAAGHTMQAIAFQLLPLGKHDRLAVWQFLRPLIEAALDA